MSAKRRHSLTKATAISVGGGDQTVSPPSSGIHVTTAGNLVVRMADDTADVTIACAANTYYEYSVKVIRQTGTTAAGFIMR